MRLTGDWWASLSPCSVSFCAVVLVTRIKGFPCVFFHCAGGRRRGVRTYYKWQQFYCLYIKWVFFMWRLKLQEWTRCCQICTSRAVHSRSVLHKQTNCLIAFAPGAITGHDEYMCVFFRSRFCDWAVWPWVCVVISKGDTQQLIIPSRLLKK